MLKYFIKFNVLKLQLNPSSVKYLFHKTKFPLLIQCTKNRQSVTSSFIFFLC